MRVEQHDGERADREQDEVFLAPENVSQIGADDIADVGTDDHHRQITAGAEYAQTAFVLQEGRQPGGDGVVAA
ncbi:hypothetical protein D3C86_2077960 [compost metagenome]